MISKNVIIVILGLIVVLLLLLLFNYSKIIKPKIPAPVEVVREVVRYEDSSKAQLDSILYINEKLDKERNLLSVSLHRYQGENKRLGSLLLSKDTFFVDSTIIVLVNNNSITDSVCNENIDNLNKQLVYKAIMLSKKDSLYMKLRQEFNKSIDSQYKLMDYTSKLEKKIKWNKANQIIWKSAAVLGGLFIINQAIK